MELKIPGSGIMMSRRLRPPLFYRDFVGTLKDRNFVGKIPLKPFGLQELIPIPMKDKNQSFTFQRNFF